MPTQWDKLFDLAVSTIDLAANAVGHKFIWSFGGGTALMLQIDHRESHDVDIFVDDPQILPYLNPTTQNYKIDRNPDAYETDGTRAIKLIFEGMGEIDFIACHDITDEPSKRTEVRGRTVELETAAEIVAKKVYFRGAELQPRDMFDVAAVAASLGDDYVISALRECGLERLNTALAVVQHATPAFVSGVIGQLMLRPHNRHLIPDAQAITARLIAEALA